MSPDVTTLISLLPSPFSVVYVLPLVLTSFVLAVSGAFFTLDRSHSFRPAGIDNSPDHILPHPLWKFDGGIGGLAIGFCFGVHVATLITLAASNHTTTPAPSPAGFCAAWLVSSVGFAIIASRWKAAAVAIFGIMGGACSTLLFIVITHPGLLARLVLLAITVLLSTIASFILLYPIPMLAFTTKTTTARIGHWFLRLASSLAGSFGLITSIAIIRSVNGWADALLRLVIDGAKEGEATKWGGSKEKGLSTAFVLFVLIGVVVDWALHRRFGRDPAQEWDAYLAEYSNRITSDPSSRQGVFTPLPTFWQRFASFFHKSSPSLPPARKIPIEEGKYPRYSSPTPSPALRRYRHDHVLLRPSSPARFVPYSYDPSPSSPPPRSFYVLNRNRIDSSRSGDSTIFEPGDEYDVEGKAEIDLGEVGDLGRASPPPRSVRGLRFERPDRLQQADPRHGLCQVVDQRDRDEWEGFWREVRQKART